MCQLIKKGRILIISYNLLGYLGMKKLFVLLVFAFYISCYNSAAFSFSLNNLSIFGNGLNTLTQISDNTAKKSLLDNVKETDSINWYENNRAQIKLHFHSANYEKATVLCKLNFNYANRNNNLSQTTISKLDLGNCYYALSKKDSAYYCFKEAYQTAKKLNDSNLIGIAIANQANYFNALNKFQLANNCLTSSLQYSSKPKLNAFLYIHLAKNFCRLEKLDSALIYKEQAQRYSKAQMGISNYLDLLNLEALYHQKKNNSSEAIFFLNKGIVIADSLHLTRKYEGFIITYCKVLIENNDYKGVLKLIEKAKTFHKNSSLNIEYYKYQGEAYKKLNQYSEALKSTNLYNKLKDSVHNKTNHLTAAGINLLFHTQNEKRKSYELSIENQLVKKDLEIRFYQHLLLIILIIIIVLSSLLIIINLRRKKKIIEKRLNLTSNEMANTTLAIVQKEKLIQDLNKKLNLLKLHEGQNVKNELNKLTQNIKINSSIEEEWREFERYFGLVHPDFFKKLGKTNSSLNARDQKLCALILLRYENKELANILSISIDAVRSAKKRLAKKLELDSAKDLLSYLQNLS